MSAAYREISSLVKLALPVCLGQLAMVGMTATDVLIAGQAGTTELAGMNLGTNVWNMVILFFTGIGFATQPLVAKQFGARSDDGVKHQMHQSMWMCFLLGVIGMLVVISTALLLAFVPFEEQLLSIAQNFLLVISLAAIPMTLLPAVRGTLEGMSLTRVIFWVNLTAFLVNIPLDYVLVHGYFGFPKLGGVGCAWATVFLVWMMFLSACAILKWHSRTRSRALFVDFQRPHRETIVRTLRLGVPIGLSIVIELSMFSGAGILIALFGTTEAAAHAVAITIASMSFVFYMGLGQGVTIRASQFLGARLDGEAWYTIKIGTAFNVGVSVVFCVLFLIFNENIVRLFSDDVEVITLAIGLLYVGAFFQVADCLQVAVINALRAYHDTASPPKYQIFAFWVLGLPLGVGLSFYQWWPGLEGSIGMWVAMVVSLTIVGVLLLRRLLNLVRSLEFEPQKNY